MKSIIQDMRQNNLINAVIMVVLGLVLVIWPHILGVMLCYLIGGALILMGVIQLIGFLRGERLGFYNKFNMIMGIALIAAVLTLLIGFMLVFNPFTAYEITMVLLGIAMLYDGGSDLVLLIFARLAQRDTDRRIREFKGNE